MRMAGLFRLAVTQEDHEDKPKHVKSRQRGDDHPQRKEAVPKQRIGMPQSLGEDAVLTEETAEGWRPGKGESADQEGPKSHRHFPAQRAHFPNILLMMQRQDD